MLWLVLPLAVLATMTRAVWISFAVSTVVLGFRLIERRLHCSCILLGGFGSWLAWQSESATTR